MKKIISWFVDNPIISNLLMLLIIIGGFATTSSIKMEIFPTFELDVVTISAIYPGASPDDVEEGDLVIFPANLFHMAPPHYSDKYRTIISFNLS